MLAFQTKAIFAKNLWKWYLRILKLRTPRNVRPAEQGALESYQETGFLQEGSREALRALPQATKSLGRRVRVVWRGECGFSSLLKQKIKTKNKKNLLRHLQRRNFFFKIFMLWSVCEAKKEKVRCHSVVGLPYAGAEDRRNALGWTKQLWLCHWSSRCSNPP